MNKRGFNFKKIPCPECIGVYKPNCQKCRGAKLFFWNGQEALFWRYPINQASILWGKIEKSLKLTINACLFIFGAIGVLALMLVIFNAGVKGEGLITLWFSPNRYLGIFWASMLGNMYLLYRLSREIDSFKKIPFYNRYQTTNSKEKEIVVNSFDDFKKIPRRNRINLENYLSFEAKQLIIKSWQIANRYQDAQISAIHFLISGLYSEQIKIIMGRLGIDPQALHLRIGSILSHQTNGNNTAFGEEALFLLAWSYDNAKVGRRRKIEPMDLLLAVVNNDATIEEMFYDLNITPEKINNVVIWLETRQKIRQNWQRLRGRAVFRPKSSMNRAMTALETRVLDMNSRDLTMMVKLGYTMPCIGRDQEIENIFQIMSGGVRRSVLLVGPSGVGKNSLIEGIAQRMVAEDVPLFLQDRRLVTLDIAKLTSSNSNNLTQQKLVRIIYEIKRAGNVILHIDNIETLIGISSGHQATLDLASIIGQSVADNVILCLATCNKKTYHQLIEGKHLIDSAFERVLIDQPEENAAIQIVQSKVGPIEYQYKVFFSYDAIEKLVVLSSRYMAERNLPEKAIELLQEVAAFTAAKKGRDSMVTSEDVAFVISQKTSIPLTTVTEDESQKLLDLENIIHQRVVGQHNAVSMVAASLRRARAKVRDNNRPIANLLFLGPTGVGKTELAKAVAEAYFGDEKRMIRLDMSEYQEALSVHRLLGSPTNRQETGFFTQAIRGNPFSLVLLDELEKAHPDIINIFLQIMDDGRLTDSEGRVVDFSNTIIIATSNAGTALIQKRISQGENTELVAKELIEDELGKYFRPELINRFDGIIVFKPLSANDVKDIARLMLKKVADMLDAKGIKFETTDLGIAKLASIGFDQNFGARPLRRVIQEKVQDKIADLILRNQVNRRDTVLINENGELTVIYAKDF